MSLTLMPVRAGGLEVSGADDILSGFFSAAHPPSHRAVPDMTELFRKSRRENPGRLFFIALLRGCRLETKLISRPRSYKSRRGPSSGMLRQGSRAVECRTELGFRQQIEWEMADYKSETEACTCSKPTSAAIFSNFDRVSGLTGSMGRRSTSSIRPIMASTAFTGMGFDSRKLACIRRRYWRWRRRALSQSLFKAAAVSCDISLGISFEQTEIMPTPPRAITGIVMASSPEKTRKLSGTWLKTSAICEMLPLASFTAMMLGILARRPSVAGSMLAAVRPTTL